MEGASCGGGISIHPSFLVFEIPPMESNKPQCPECGGEVWSNGPNWQCKKCNRRFLKIKRLGKFWEEKTKNNPSCIYCGGKTVSNGTKWLCKDCGRQWSKRRR